MEAAVLVPIKAFSNAKGRLAPQVAPDARADLARMMAAQVLAAARPYAAFVVCDDDDVADWASERGADVLWTPGLGLNGALDHAATVIDGKGFDHVVIAHGDLPLATSFEHLVVADTVTLVPDHRLDGTNVQTRPSGASLPASYGAASFRRHLGAALQRGYRVCVVTDPRLARDVDTIDDLVALGISLDPDGVWREGVA